MSNTSHIKSFVTVLKSTIQHGQFKASKSVNTTLVQLYFLLGAAISKKVREAQWGDKVLETVSAELQKELKGLKGFSHQNLKKMKLFYEAYPFMLEHCDLFHELTGSENKSIEKDVTVSNQIQIVFGSPPGNQIETKMSSPVENLFIQNFWNIGFSSHVIIYSDVDKPTERAFQELPNNIKQYLSSTREPKKLLNE